MNNLNKLRPFIFVNNDRIISPPLITVREYARWLESMYDEYTINYELYLRAQVDDMKVLEFHPGTRIGQYFDKAILSDNKFVSWYIHQESPIMTKLSKWKLAERKDVAQNLSGERKGLRLLRLYSSNQIELYVRTRIDRSFSISGKLLEPKKIVLRDSDMKYVIMPKAKKPKRSLLTGSSRVTMTIDQIEEQLGHKISIIS